MSVDDLVPEPWNAEESADLPAEDGKSSFAGRMLVRIFDVVDPFEAVFEIFSEPEAGIALLVFVAAITVVILLISGLWSGVQEVLFGGGPPQVLGLK
jgi:hypothetical protein